MKIIPTALLLLTSSVAVYPLQLPRLLRVTVTLDLHCLVTELDRFANR